SITLDVLSRGFGFHPHYLNELFQKHLGISPIKYLQSVRLEKASELLELTNLSVAQIAEQVGLSLPYFSRLFQVRMGIPPSEYRSRSLTSVNRKVILGHDFDHRIHWLK
ncbi:MAG: helix-turn-helix transcriptional regulator, partial [Gorillibacterium sp.]|nr:helix-turn-helix transcriptional regulator [Gorillibacterium sp.]